MAEDARIMSFHHLMLFGQLYYLISIFIVKSFKNVTVQNDVGLKKEWINIPPQ